MKINNLYFITPKTNHDKIVLKKNYSKTFFLKDGSSINLASNIGKKKTQQDSVVFAENNGYLLMLVADGVGGLEQGEIASYIVAKTIIEWFDSKTINELNQLTEITLNEILTEIISKILKKIPAKSATTLNMSIIGPKVTLIVNIGDSRTYTIKDKEIILRTKDDSFAFEALKPKTEEERNELRFFRNNNIITNAISQKEKACITITTIKNEDYDVLCHMTDGVSDILAENNIRICLLDDEPAKTLVDETIETEYLYNPNGGYSFAEYIYPSDNTSTIVYTKKRQKNN